MIDKCESPIERQMLDALVSLFRWHDHCIAAEVIPQYKIGKYRADIMVRAVYSYRQPVHVVVECDGREFHRTPEQKSRDYQRTLDIEAAGFAVLRFTGSEIYAGAKECAQVVFDEITRLSYCREAPGNGLL